MPEKEIKDFLDDHKNIGKLYFLSKIHKQNQLTWPPRYIQPWHVK